MAVRSVLTKVFEIAWLLEPVLFTPFHHKERCIITLLDSPVDFYHMRCQECDRSFIFIIIESHCIHSFCSIQCTLFAAIPCAISSGRWWFYLITVNFAIVAIWACVIINPRFILIVVIIKIILVFQR